MHELLLPMLILYRGTNLGLYVSLDCAWWGHLKTISRAMDSRRMIVESVIVEIEDVSYRYDS